MMENRASEEWPDLYALEDEGFTRIRDVAGDMLETLLALVYLKRRIYLDIEATHKMRLVTASEERREDDREF